MRSNNLVVDRCSRPCPGSEDRGDDKMRDGDLLSGDKGSDRQTDRRVNDGRLPSGVTCVSHVCRHDRDRGKDVVDVRLSDDVLGFNVSTWIEERLLLQLTMPLYFGD